MNVRGVIGVLGALVAPVEAADLQVEVRVDV
ncbi:spore coat protein, partial [Pseudomonas sp. HMWF006]